MPWPATIRRWLPGATGPVTSRAARGRSRGHGRRRAAAGRTADRGAGRGRRHSFSPLCATDGLLLDLSALAGVTSVDAERGLATVAAGTRIADLGEPLRAAGVGLANQGDVDTQAIAGAIATGTHGSGPFGSLATIVRSAEVVLPSGDLVRQTRCGAGAGPARRDRLARARGRACVQAARAHVALRLRRRRAGVGGGCRRCSQPRVLLAAAARPVRFQAVRAQHRRAVGRPAATAAATRHHRALPEARARRLEPPHLPVRARHAIRRDGVRGAGRVGVRRRWPPSAG